MKKENVLKLVISIAIPLLVGAIGSYFTTPAIPGWYAELQKPEINPPNWVFAPAWTTLYVLMGISLFLVWRKKDEIKDFFAVMVVFGAQLFLNSTWSIFFFGMESPEKAIVNILMLWIAILFTIILFWKISKPAAYLLVPYLLWVTFASYLNYQIILLN